MKVRILIIISLMLVFIGFIARIQHWPYGLDMIIIGRLIFGLLAIPMRFLKLLRTSSEKWISTYYQLVIALSLVFSIEAIIMYIEFLSRYPIPYYEDLMLILYTLLIPPTLFSLGRLISQSQENKIRRIIWFCFLCLGLFFCILAAIEKFGGILAVA